MRILQKTLEEYFYERNLSKLKLNDIDHHKRKIKKEYNEQVLLDQMSKVEISENGDGDKDLEEEKEEESAGGIKKDKRKEANGSKRGKQEPQYDLKHLDETIRILREDERMCVDPDHQSLDDIKLINMPAANKNCPCGRKQKFKKCCQANYEMVRTDVMNKIEEILLKRGYNKKQQPALIMV